MKKNLLAIIVFVINALLMIFVQNIQEIELNTGLNTLTFLQSLWIRPQPPRDIVDIEITSNTFIREPEIRRCLANYQGIIDIRCFSRQLHSQMIDRLSQHGARLIVFNMLFKESRGQEDVQLAESIRKAGNVLLQSYQGRRFLGQDMEIVDVSHTVPLLDDSAASAPLPVSDNQAATPHFWLFMDLIHVEKGAGQNYRQPILPVLALHVLILQQYSQPFLTILKEQSPETAALISQHSQDYNHRAIMNTLIGNLQSLSKQQPDWTNQSIASLAQQTQLSAEARQQLTALLQLYQRDDDFYLQAYGPVKTVDTIPYEQVAQLLDTQPDYFRGKVVFIGPSLEFGRSAKGGSFTTPYGDISSTELLATTFANLRDGDFLKPPDTSLTLLLAAVWLGLIMLTLFTLRIWTAALILIVATLLYLLTVLLLFHQKILWLPSLLVFIQVTLSLIALFVDHYFKLGELIRRRLPWAVRESVAPGKMNKIVSSNDQFGVAMATDNSGYTRLSETRGDQWLGKFMVAYQAMVEEYVARYRGVIKDWAGDGMIALWIEKRSHKHNGAQKNQGDVHSEQEHLDSRRQALLSALSLLDAVEEFNKDKDVHFPLRIGMSYGSLWLSVVGEFKVFGDTINIAHRLEGLNKITGTQILVTEELTKGQTDFIFRRMGYFPLHNHEALTVYELMGQDNTDKKQLAERFEAALAVYEQQDWQKALAVFASILVDHPLDGPSGYYHQCCLKKFSEDVQGG